MSSFKKVVVYTLHVVVTEKQLTLRAHTFSLSCIGKPIYQHVILLHKHEQGVSKSG